MTIGFCITACDKDIHLLDRCLYFINQQTHQPDEIILIVSGTKIVDTIFNIKILSHDHRISSGEARNKLIQNSKSDVLCMCDIDDEIHPQKCETINQIFVDTNVAAMVHDYNIGHTKFNFFDLEKDLKTFEIENIDPNPNSTNILCPINGDITHGHITINKKLIVDNNLSYPDSSIGEDGIFCRKILALHNSKFLFCPLKLINYIK